MFQFFKYILIFLTLLFLTACGDSESDYDRGIRIGKSIGYDNGYYNGIDTGERRGYRKGFSEGNETGFKEGEKIGFTKGFFDGNRTGDHLGHLRGYNEGYIDGDENRNYRIIRESTLPMFAIIVLMFFMVLFIIYFRKILIEKGKALVYYLYNLYTIFDFKEKLFIQENHQNEINNLKAEILTFELTQGLQETSLYDGLVPELKDIKQKIKLFIYEKQFYLYHNIKMDYQKSMNKIISKKHLLEKEKYFLLKEVKQVFFKTYLQEFNDSKYTKEINNEDFFRITENDLKKHSKKRDLDFSDISSFTLRNHNKTNREKIIYILLSICDFALVSLMFYSISKMYLQ